MSIFQEKEDIFYNKRESFARIDDNYRRAPERIVFDVGEPTIIATSFSLQGDDEHAAPAI